MLFKYFKKVSQKKLWNPHKIIRSIDVTLKLFLLWV